MVNRLCLTSEQVLKYLCLAVFASEEGFIGCSFKVEKCVFKKSRQCLSILKPDRIHALLGD